MDIVQPKPIRTGTRLAAMVLDHFLMTLVAAVFVIPEMATGFISVFKSTHDAPPPPFAGPLSYLSLVGFALYFCKDCIHGRSLAKRMLKLQVVDNNTGLAASPFKCFIRNLFIILWPIEVIVALINPERRLGDRIAGTRLTTFDPTAEQPKLNIVELLVSLVVAFGLLYLTASWLNKWIAAREQQEVHFVATSYNPTESQALAQTLTDSLGTYFTPDVKIYDQTDKKDTRYISIVLKLKENYLGNDEEAHQLHSSVTNLVYAKYPKASFAGQLKYIFSSDYKIQNRTAYFGVGAGDDTAQ